MAKDWSFESNNTDHMFMNMFINFMYSLFSTTDGEQIYIRTFLTLSLNVNSHHDA